MCANPPAKLYSSSRRFVISTTKRTIREKEGNEEDGFCSNKCRLRSGWVEKALGEEAVWLREKRGEVELLEEIEERGNIQRVSSATVAAIPAISAQETGRGPPNRQSVRDVSDTSAADVRGGERPASTQPPRTVKPSQVSDLLSTLAIHERDTSSSTPSPPSNTASLPSRDPPPVLHIPKQTKRAPSSLLGPAASLSTTLISASRQLGLVPQLAPDSDDDGHDGERSEEEWEKAMGWGADDQETLELFEEAKKAREIMELGEGG